MTQIYDLQQRAEVLRKKTATDSISPEDVGGLQADTLAYIANMERYASSLGIKKVYTSVTEMSGDESPVSSTGMPLKAGQLVTIFNAEAPDAENSGEIYAFQNPGWVLVGRLDAGTADTLKKLIEGDKATVTNNNRNAFVWLGNFETWAEAQAEIDKLHATGEDNTKVGEFRLLLNGRNLIVRNFVQNWATGVFTQTVQGSIQWNGETQTMDQSLNIKTYERQYNGAEWTTWEEGTAKIELAQELSTEDGSENKAISQKAVSKALANIEGVIYLEWNTDVVTTRNQVDSSKRKPGAIITYIHPQKGRVIEQHIYTEVKGYYWSRDEYWEYLVYQSELNSRLNAFDKSIEVGGVLPAPSMIQTAGQMIDTDGTITTSDRGYFYVYKNIVAKRKGLNDKLSFNVASTTTESYFCFHDENDLPIQTNEGFRVLIEKDSYYEIPANAYYLYSERSGIKDYRYGINAALINSADLMTKNSKNILFDFLNPSAPITGYQRSYNLAIAYDLIGFIEKIVLWCAADTTFEIRKFKRIYTEDGSVKGKLIDYIGSYAFTDEGRNELTFDKPLFLNSESLILNFKSGGIKWNGASSNANGNWAQFTIDDVVEKGQKCLYEVYMKDNIQAWMELFNQPKQEIVKMGMPIFTNSAGRLSDKLYFLGNWKKSGSSVKTNCSSQSAYAKISNTSTVAIKWSKGVIAYKINDGEYSISEDAGGTQKTLTISDLDATISNYLEIKALRNDYDVVIDDVTVDEGGSVTPVYPKRKTIHFLGDSIIQGNSLTNSGLESFAYLTTKYLNCNFVSYAASGYKVYYNGVKNGLMTAGEEGFENADIFVMALTTNGAGGSGNFDSEYSQILKYVKSVFPGIPLICLVPQNNSNRDKIKQLAIDNQCLYMSAGMFGYENHPNAAKSAEIAEYLTRKFIEMFGVNFFNN